jgi:hypothetical protein
MLKLTRILYHSGATYGYLTHPDGLTLCTVERPWRSNAPYISCVPEGLYELVPHDGIKFHGTWALVNEPMGVYHLPVDKAKRSAIVIHAANTADELQGCIAPGKEFAEIMGAGHNKPLGVTDSRAAMEELRAAMKTRAMAAILIQRIDPWRL